MATVFDYEGGKMDWLARGLPYEGEADLIGRHLRDACTCLPDELVGAVAPRVGDDDMCVVADASRTVLGVLTGHELAKHGDAKAIDVARFGPTTVRPSEERAALDKRMGTRDVTRMLVTDPSGRLLGLYER